MLTQVTVTFELAGVAAGALIAFGGQYLLRRGERHEPNDALLLEQFALVIALSEDYRNRVWEECSQVATEHRLQADAPEPVRCRCPDRR